MGERKTLEYILEQNRFVHRAVTDTTRIAVFRKGYTEQRECFEEWHAPPCMVERYFAQLVTVRS